MSAAPSAGHGVRVGEVTRLTPTLRRVTQDNPGPFTGPGTNTFLIGGDSLWILDPGPEDERHFEQLVEAVGEARVLGVLVTHAHPDHWPLAPRLAAHFGVATSAFAHRDGFEPDHTLEDGDLLKGEGTTLEVLHTPGHASDHLCFFERESGAVFVGDHVMGWSTTIIAPPDGDLNSYLASLERLIELEPSLLHSAHGPVIERPIERMREILHHRRNRTRQILEALARSGEPRSIVEMATGIYAELDPSLMPAARMSLLAHVLALRDEGRIEAVAEVEDPLAVPYRRTDDGPSSPESPGRSPR